MPVNARRQKGRPKAVKRLNKRKKASPGLAVRPASPRVILAQARRRSVLRKRDGGNPGTAANTAKPKPARTQLRTGRLSPKRGRIAILPPSSDPLEKNCLRQDPCPKNYTFVPKGDVYITRHCRSKTKEAHQVVYVVYDDKGKSTIGLRVPYDIHESVRHSAAETAETRAQAVHNRDERDLTKARQLLRTQFPLMPESALETIVNHAFLKGAGRVGRATTVSDKRKAILATEAHIRHTQTPYDSLLHSGLPREEAREAVFGLVRTIRATWEGGDQEALKKALALRNRAI
ncbi:DUF2293 domain-containing protein [Aspergillus homomorphus CBS 101889]|uniref:DUF2293 domain-containing protein n=1 Tax=Aspergillus homomorphus (strain CBS 101889) TaxID=1450537 RepID=A0A395IAE6_ASPHC|nr:hypothetical protein BO97DRAFT_335594 [Aspergillus homomorphus CBS 101889]RAL17001.1 hypothetical protein BO97DRAFT_335594 [Aspergillus homomorphus CBS 101889]